MKIGLVGMPSSGKTTVFNALTGLSAQTGLGATRGKTNLGVVKVPDARVDGLAEIFHPKKKTYAEITFSDVAAGHGSVSAGGMDRQVADAMREVDALCQVVRDFESPEVGAPAAPLREIVDLESELILADLELVEKRIERLHKDHSNPREEAGLETLKAHLDESRPLRSLALSEEQWAPFVSLRFLSAKPMLLVVNVAEEAVASPAPEAVAAHAAERGLGLVVLSAKVEGDIAQMPAEEQKEFAASLGLPEPARDRFLREAYGLLDLVSFLTCGPDECRAWPIRSGTPAQRAAGKVHSDIERGFIRAEVIRIEDLLALGTEARCREAGKLRSEGKEYVVRDGDVINFRFNV